MKIKVKEGDAPMDGASIVHGIRIPGGVSKRKVKRVVAQHQKNVRKAMRLDNAILRGIASIRDALDVYESYGLITSEERCRIGRQLFVAENILSERNAKEVFERVSRKSIERIARKLGAEIVGEEEEHGNEDQ